MIRNILAKCGEQIIPILMSAIGAALITMMEKYISGSSVHTAQGIDVGQTALLGGSLKGMHSAFSSIKTGTFA